MDITDSRYKKLVAEYAEDPEFLSFSPEDQDSILETAFQKMYGEIPKTLSFIEKAIRNTQGKPLFSGSDVVPIAHQFAEGVVQNAPQNIAQNPMTTAMSGLPGVQAKAGAQIYNIAQLIPGLKDKIPALESENSIVEDNPNLTPQTLGGKIIGMGANIAGGSVIPGAIAASGAVKAAKGLRTSPIKKEIKGIEDLIQQSIRSEAPFEEELSQIKNVEGYLKQRASRTKNKLGDELSNISESESAFNKEIPGKADKLAYEGSKAVASKVDESFREAREAYRSILDSDVSNVTIEDLTKVLDKTIEAKGIRGKQFVRPSESRLVNLRDNVASRMKEAVPDEISVSRDPLTNLEYSSVVSKGSPKVNPKLEKITEVKNFKNQLLDSFGGDIDLEAEFLNHLGTMLSEKGLSGFQDANALYSKAYDLALNSKKLRMPAIKRVASGKDYALDDLVKAEEGFGTDYVRKASQFDKENKLQKMMFEQRKKGVSQKVSETDSRLSSQQSRLAKRQSLAERKLAAKKQEQDFLKGKIPDLERKIQDVRFRQAAAGGVASLIGAGGLLSKLFNLDKNR